MTFSKLTVFSVTPRVLADIVCFGILITKSIR